MKLREALKSDGQTVENIAAGVHARNRYGQHLFIGRAAGVLCGAMRVPDGREPGGEAPPRTLTPALAPGRQIRK